MTDLVELRPSAIAGEGCHATRPIPAGTHLGTARIIITSDDWDWRGRSLLGRKMNHSDHPNTRIVVKAMPGSETWESWTCRDVAAGEELTVDYRSTQ